VSLMFPNTSRNYDTARRRVRFWGHDGAFEICFFVEQSAIALMSPGTVVDETGALTTFDRSREKIIAAARSAYRGHGTGTYSLVAANF